MAFVCLFPADGNKQPKATNTTATSTVIKGTNTTTNTTTTTTTTITTTTTTTTKTHRDCLCVTVSPSCLYSYIRQTRVSAQIGLNLTYWTTQLRPLPAEHGHRPVCGRDSSVHNTEQADAVEYRTMAG